MNPLIHDHEVFQRYVIEHELHILKPGEDIPQYLLGLENSFSKEDVYQRLAALKEDLAEEKFLELQSACGVDFEKDFEGVYNVEEPVTSQPYCYLNCNSNCNIF